MTTTKDVYLMGQAEFTALLDSVTTPEHIWETAVDVYEELSRLTGQNCMDSVLREWAFVWASVGLGRDYDEIYDRWLEI